MDTAQDMELAFSNVHEGPQSISKFNTLKLREGMIVSNEPVIMKRKIWNKIENLIYVEKVKKLILKNLTCL